MILPSIDIRNGKAVQLVQGRDLLLVDDRDPVALARDFGRFGPVAVVDLDAALGTGSNRDVVAACCRAARCRVGGGVRTEDDVRGLIRAGAEKVMIGTRAEPEFLRSFPREWIVVCVDAREGRVVDRGWTHATGEPVLERASRLAPFCSSFLYTCVEREGMLAGPDLETAAALRRATDRPVTVAGGIDSVDAIRALEELGCDSQLGRALYEGRLDLTTAWCALLRWNGDGLLPVVVQDDRTGSVLMVAWTNEDALQRAFERGEGWYWSRSRRTLWRKGETSGHTQELVAARWDCDRDTLLFRVRQTGPACHLGRASCFGDGSARALDALESTIDERSRCPSPGGYTASLLADPSRVAAKLREEAEEVIDARDPPDVAWECADVLYHLLVRMRAAGVTLEDVESELRARQRPGGV